jgi:hypothetical protein
MEIRRPGRTVQWRDRQHGPEGIAAEQTADRQGSRLTIMGEPHPACRQTWHHAEWKHCQQAAGCSEASAAIGCLEVCSLHWVPRVLDLSKRPGEIRLRCGEIPRPFEA